MFKKVTVQQLRLGMYIHALGGSWIHHPFWRSSFTLDDAEDLAQLQASAVPEVWLDLSKGLDVLDDRQSPAHPIETTPPPVSAPDLLGTEPTPLGQEIAQARALCAQARDAVMDMFGEARMGRAVNMARNTILVQEITNSVLRNPDALISVARLKTADNYTYMHSVAVSALMVGLAKQLDYCDEKVHQAAMAGLLHDIGKAQSKLSILNKPGALTDDEFAHMKRHPVVGYELLKHSIDDEAVLDACLHHHERLDGLGYPDRLQGDAITELARMNTICDVYDAITSNRPYKKGWSPAVALQRMAQWCNGHLDQRLFSAFVKALGVYPIGSLVRLNNGELAVVYAPCASNLLTPKVVRFYDTTRNQFLCPPKATDLSCVAHLRILQREDPDHWSFPDLDKIWQAAAAQETTACPVLE